VGKGIFFIVPNLNFSFLSAAELVLFFATDFFATDLGVFFATIKPFGNYTVPPALKSKIG
jgi:hypothetical protein